MIGSAHAKHHPAVCSLLLALFVLAPARAASAQDLPNFTGKWSLDVAKSDFGPMPPPESMTYVIDHKEPALKIVTTQKGQQGEMTNERNVTTDGKDNVNKMRMPTGETDVKSTTKWAERRSRPRSSSTSRAWRSTSSNRGSCRMTARC